nr:MAG TPA: hypothetical protein [Caudoviricetes sp.]
MSLTNIDVTRNRGTNIRRCTCSSHHNPQKQYQTKNKQQYQTKRLLGFDRPAYQLKQRIHIKTCTINQKIRASRPSTVHHRVTIHTIYKDSLNTTSQRHGPIRHIRKHVHPQKHLLTNMQLRATIQRQPNQITAEIVRHRPHTRYPGQPAIIRQNTFSPLPGVTVDDHDAAPIDLASVPCFASIRFPPL